ncbi:MAG: cupin domain-containing protein, partial [Halobacteriales archaeon]|nr:cupin domain-containing protein [Halobacteriales archaeon]
GIEQKVLHTDERSGRIDKVIKFPVGYVEPRHTHEAEHSTMILRGRMLLYGRELTTGDYLFGPSEIPHGPMRYPDGCVVFSSSIGGSIKHEWDEDDIE